RAPRREHGRRPGPASRSRARSRRLTRSTATARGSSVVLEEDAVLDGALAQGDLGADVVARDPVLLADALEVALRRLVRDPELEGDRLHRLARAVQRHDAALLRAQLRRAADFAGAERHVAL